MSGYLIKGKKGSDKVKKEIILFILVVVITVAFWSVIFYLKTNLVKETEQLREKLYNMGINNYKTLSSLNSENLSKIWDVYSRKLTIRKVRLKDVLFQEDSRRKRKDSEDVIYLIDFLGILSYGLTRDMKVVLPAVLVSVLLALTFPLIFLKNVRLSSFVPISISYIPPFLVLVLLFYFASSSKMLIILFLGILGSTRLGIQLSNSVRSLENDDYVIYMILGGNSRASVTFKYTYFELLDSIIWSILWTFYTIFSLKIAMDSLSLNAEFEVNTGSILMGIFSELPSKNAMLQFSLLAVLVASLFVIMFSLANSAVGLYNALIGIRQAKKVHATSKNKKRVLWWRQVSQFNETCKIIDHNKISRIVVNGFKIHSKHQGTQRPILAVSESIELSLGDKIFVKGFSGSGKTLLTNSIVGIVWDKKLSYEGQIIYQFADNNFDILNNRKIRHQLLKSGIIELVPQNPKHGFSQYSTVKKQIEDFNLMEPFKELLERYFPNIFDRVMRSINLTPSKINDGALQVINFILAVARMRDKYGIVLFDEPIASLSKENTERVYKMVEEMLWNDRHIVLWIGHELETLERLPFNKILSVTEHENNIVAFVSNIEQEFINTYRMKTERLVCLLNELIQYQARRIHEEAKHNVRYNINVKKITFKHREIKPSSEITIDAGDIVFIHGENGSGKTTMIKALVGYLQKEVNGEIVWFNNNEKLIINKSSFYKLRKSYWKEIDAIFQNPDFSVPKYLKINEKNLRNSNKISQESFEELLKKYNLNWCYNKRFYQLSYGQKKRVKLLRVLLKRPSIIFLDEPTASLDVDNIELFIKSITDIVRNNPKTSLFIVTHQDIFQKVLSEKVKLIEMKNHPVSSEES